METIAQRIHTLVGGTADAPARRVEREGIGFDETQGVAGPPATGHALPAGARIRHYEVIRELGAGGMGHVLLARDTKLGRRVALKFLTTSSPDLTQRFLAEARLTARCQHENIVVIHEVDEHGGLPYMVLEYLEGATLRRIMDEGPLVPSRAVELMVPVARALACAHEFGIVHRDLKPDNVFVTTTGAVKVLDFGIAKLFEDAAPRPAPAAATRRTMAFGAVNPAQTQAGGLVGTIPYMSPEQVGMDAIDHRTDVWAAGIILYEMVTGRHPVMPFTPHRHMFELAQLDDPFPSVRDAAPALPERLERLIDRCLAKKKAERVPDARTLVDELEALLPGRIGRQLGAEESPYPGLSSFQEGDADRFFGRAADVVAAATRLRERALLAIAGPSGVGKSSFVRAGLVPALKASGEAWESLILRPGRSPLASLASALLPLATTEAGVAKVPEHDVLVERLRAEPGYVGTLLRARAARKGTRILLFIDQLEELYTLVPDDAERRAFTACLAGIADDAAAPLRVVVSIRSDFLDRVGEDARFLDEVTRGLVFLQPLGRAGLREALTGPLDAAGHRFEAPELTEAMLDALEGTPGALPLLQFAAGKLWDARDRRAHLLTRAAYDAMGGVSGALATHADHVLEGMTPDARRLARAVLLRLVTPERTRAIVDVADLRGLSSDPGAIDRILDQLAGARLIVVQTRGDDPAVEIVHESLLSGWPRLRRWLDEGQEDAAFLDQLRAAAKQYHQRGRSAGLLWRGEAAADARLFRARFKGELPERERRYLDEVLALETRAQRRRRIAVIATIALLLALVAAGAVGLVSIRRAERRAVAEAGRAQEQSDLATNEAERAQRETERAQTEAVRARDAERTVADQLRRLQEEQAAKERAERAAREAEGEIVEKDQDLAEANTRLREALARAKDESRKARDAQVRAERAAADLEQALAREKARAERLEKERKKIQTELK
jgi:hypothetical protein